MGSRNNPPLEEFVGILGLASNTHMLVGVCYCSTRPWRSRPPHGQGLMVGEWEWQGIISISCCFPAESFCMSSLNLAAAIANQSGRIRNTHIASIGASTIGIHMRGGRVNEDI